MISDREHVDLAGLLSGELAPSLRANTLEHLHSCEDCRSQLAETVALVGELKDAGRHGPVDPTEVPPLDLTAFTTSAPVTGQGLIRPPTRGALDRNEPATRRRHTATPRAVLAVAAGLVALVGGVAIGHSLRVTTRPTAEVRLAAVGQRPTPAAGSARMVGSGAAQQMKVTLTGLTLPASRDSIEVWLINTRTGRTRAVGTMPAATAGTMTATFLLPTVEAAGFDAVDVTIQAPDDHGHHSSNSVLRGQVA